MAKRIFDLVFTIPGIVVLAPVFVIIAILIKYDSSGAVFFRQERVGRYGKIFRIYKFRTMIENAERHGKQITVGRDARITAVGNFLRKYKLDELPQLFNVLLGDMSLVGPRPEVPRYIEEYSEEDRNIVLSVKPGITDNASIEFRAESEILGKAKNPEREYIDVVLPIKIGYYKDYVRRHNVAMDFVIIMKTIAAICR